MFIVAFPCQAAFLGFATWWGWIDLDLGLAGWTCFAVTVSVFLGQSAWCGRRTARRGAWAGARGSGLERGVPSSIASHCGVTSNGNCVLIKQGAFSLGLSHWMTLFFWSKDLDPE